MASYVAGFPVPLPLPPGPPVRLDQDAIARASVCRCARPVLLRAFRQVRVRDILAAVNRLRASRRHPQASCVPTYTAKPINLGEGPDSPVDDGV